MEKPDWGLWAYIEKLTLQQCVCLSLDVEPTLPPPPLAPVPPAHPVSAEPRTTDGRMWAAPVVPASSSYRLIDEGEQLERAHPVFKTPEGERRLNTLRRHISMFHPLLIPRELQGVSFDPAELKRLRFIDFLNWAEAQKWDLPATLRSSEPKKEPGQTPNAAKLPETISTLVPAPPPGHKGSLTSLAVPRPPVGVPIPPPRPPTVHSGDYLATLHQWAALPEVVPVPSVVNLLAVVLNQNAQALTQVVQAAIENREVRLWGWDGSRTNPGWAADTFVWQRHIEPLSTPVETEVPGVYRYDVKIDENKSKVEWESIGANPAEIVALLERRGRAIPQELRSLLPAERDDQSASEASADVDHPVPADGHAERNRMKKAAVVAKLEREWPGIHAALGDASKPGNEDLKAAQLGGGWWDIDMVITAGRARGKLKAPGQLALASIFPVAASNGRV